ncbi:MAG TPA: antibiotic biosynthesis monooxygenase [Candidatus Dormibacteraeota bacterium]|nr:antibiotic biosynthesis monooxygenase [Candidatus Dormibacteraeota bacterium]
MSEDLTLSRLDQRIATTGLPVRAETLEQLWNVTEPIGPTGLSEGEVLILVTLRARPGQESRLHAAAVAFVESSRQQPGSLASTLHTPPHDGATLHLLERFASRRAFEAHMAADYFAVFQREQQEGMLAAPAEAVFLQGRR